jgi:RNA polymerase sigma factor (sigma-70 family)
LSLDELSRHDAFVARLAASLVADPGAADDVAQQALFAAWRRPPGDPERTRGYLSRIVARFASNRRRGDSRRARHERAASRPETGPAADVAEREEARRRLWEVVEELPTDLRDVIRLRFFDGRSSSDVASALGVPVAQVYARQQRALARLRSALDRREGGRDAWIAWALPLARAGGFAPGGAAILGGTTMATKIGVTTAAAGVLIWLSLSWGEGGAPPAGIAPPTSERPASSASDAGATAVASSRPDEARAIASAAFVDPDARRATLVVVREADRAPVVGAEIVLFGGTGAPRRAKTDAKGAASFDPLAGRGRAVVLSPSRPASVFDVSLAEGRVELALPTGLVVRGMVEIDGAPPGREVALKLSGFASAGATAPGAAMLAIDATGGEERNGVSARTNPDGSFRIEGVREDAFGHVAVVAEDPAYEPDPAHAVWGVVPAELRFPLRADLGVVRFAKRHELRGRLRAADGGPPPRGAFVVVEAAAGANVAVGSPTAPTPVAEDGAFSVRLPLGPDRSGVRTLEIVAFAGSGAPPQTFRPQPGPPGPRDVGDLKLDAVRTVRCRVRDAAGAAVVGARVVDSEADPFGERGDLASTTGADGAATLSLPIGARELRVAAQGFATATVAVPKDASTSDVVLRPAALLEVRVLDADGRGVPESTVRLRRTKRAEPEATPTIDAVRGFTVGVDAVPADQDEPAFGAMTDRDGVLSLSGFSVGDRIEVEAPGAGPRQSATVGASGATVEIRTPADAPEFAVRLVAEDGGDVLGAALLFDRPEGGERYDALRPGTDGVFRVRRVGWRVATVRSFGDPEYADGEIEVAPRGTGEPTTLKVARRRAVRLRVVDDAGEPVRDANVEPPPGDEGALWIESVGGAEFVLRGVGDGPLRLTAGWGDDVAERTASVEGATATLTLPSTGYVEVVVPADRATESTAAYLRDPATDRKRWAPMIPAADGKAASARIRAPVGKYEATIDGPGFEAAGKRKPPVAEVRRNETTRVEIKP